MLDCAVAFCRAATGGKIEGAIQVQGVSRNSLDRCQVNSPESIDIPLSSGHGV